jgi:hypothetical protein
MGHFAASVGKGRGAKVEWGLRGRARDLPSSGPEPGATSRSICIFLSTLATVVLLSSSSLFSSSSRNGDTDRAQSMFSMAHNPISVKGAQVRHSLPRTSCRRIDAYCPCHHCRMVEVEIANGRHDAGFYWDAPISENKRGEWWNFLAEKVPQLAASGINSLWLPPFSKAASPTSYGMTHMTISIWETSIKRVP